MIRLCQHGFGHNRLYGRQASRSIIFVCLFVGVSHYLAWCKWKDQSLCSDHGLTNGKDQWQGGLEVKCLPSPPSQKINHITYFFLTSVRVILIPSLSVCFKSYSRGVVVLVSIYNHFSPFYLFIYFSLFFGTCLKTCDFMEPYNFSTSQHLVSLIHG